MALDARQYSLTGAAYAKPTYNDFTGVATLQGPLKIPHLLPRGPTFFINYQWTRNSSALINTGLVPTLAERGGNLAGLTNASGQPVTVYNPVTGLAYAGNQVPVSPQAQALLQLYPQPNIANGSNYNYQAPVLNTCTRTSGRRDLIAKVGPQGSIGGECLARRAFVSDSVNLFGFTDQSGTLGISSSIHWSHPSSSHAYFCLRHDNAMPAVFGPSG